MQKFFKDGCQFTQFLMLGIDVLEKFKRRRKEKLVNQIQSSIMW
jgi:hypothetical protein